MTRAEPTRRRGDRRLSRLALLLAYACLIGSAAHSAEMTPATPSDTTAPATAASAPPATAEVPPAPATATPIAIAAAPAPVAAVSQPTRAAPLPHELSPIGMFMSADIVVKAVMIGLLFASVAVWTVWLAKSLELIGARRRLAAARIALASGRSLADVEVETLASSPVAERLVAAARHELALSADVSSQDGIAGRVSSSLDQVSAAAARSMRRGGGVLASVGATAPFIGLFGTVWGIMNSFIGISKSQTTNLAVVAPGIAEALLATAIGLVAAIPAVLLYNHLNRAIAGYKALVGETAAEVERLVSRDLDRAQAGHGRLRAVHAAE